MGNSGGIEDFSTVRNLINFPSQKGMRRQCKKLDGGVDNEPEARNTSPHLQWPRCEAMRKALRRKNKKTEGIWDKRNLEEIKINEWTWSC